MTELLIMAGVGALGGLARSLVGARKAYLQKRRFTLGYFAATVITATIIGAIVGGVLGTSSFVALVAGYAGTDLLEGLAKGLKLMPMKVG